MTSVVLAMMAAPTAAAPGEPTGSALVGAVVACGDVREPERRLACYDAAVGRLGSATAKRDVVVIDRAQAQREREAGFGLPRGGKVARGGRPPRVETVESKTYDGRIASVGAATGYQLYVIRMADGSAWRTIEAGDPPSAGEPVHIARGLIGNYLATIKGRRAIRVERIR